MDSHETTDPAGNAVTQSERTFANIVVALDGSNEAEAILPYVEPIARAFDSMVTFVCAVVPIEQTVSGEIALTGASAYVGATGPLFETQTELGEEDASYLTSMRHRWADRGIDVECYEPAMRAPEAIAKIARDKRADLIAMATHGRSGISRSVLGSVADEVVRTAPCPVLLIRPA